MSEIRFKYFELIKDEIKRSKEYTEVKYNSEIIRELSKEGSVLYFSLRFNKADLKYTTLEDHYEKVKKGIDVDVNTLLFCCMRHRVLYEAYRKVIQD